MKKDDSFDLVIDCDIQTKVKSKVSFYPEGDHLLPISFHPVTGEKILPTDIYDFYKSLNVVLFNPWNGERRDCKDVNDDPLGVKSIMLDKLTGFELLVGKMRRKAPALEVMDTFNELNISPDYVYGDSRNSFLMLLIYHGYKELFFDFFNLASNKEHVSKYGESIFHLSVKEPEILRLLLSTGNYPDVDVSYPSEFNNAIIIASSRFDNDESMRKSMESIRILVEAGGNIDYKNTHGRTALMNAAASGNYDFVKFVLSLGADKTIVDNNGRDAKSYTCSRRHEIFEDY